ncbi:MAG: phage portal protein [Tannerellaceae bacterium]
MNKEYRKDGKVLTKEAVLNDDGSIRHKPEFETEPVARIALPIEQDIVNIHTAFTVGVEPKLSCTPNNDKEKELFSILKIVHKKNKLRYQNKQVVRSWLSEQEVAEYWFTVKETSFWKKVAAKLGFATQAERRLKSVLWSPFRGDKLFPKFNREGDFVGIGREYTVKDDEKEEKFFMFIDDKKVFLWNLTNGVNLVMEFEHKFPKCPVIYAYRDSPLCEKIKTIRERLEETTSNFADCIDRNFFPYLILEGDYEGVPKKTGKSRTIKIENQGKAYYLDWTQTPEMIKLELDGLLEKAYSMTNTPRISFENLKGIGNAFSGKSFEFAFMGTNMAVDNHSETIGLFLQRRENFLVSAIGSVNTKYATAADTIDVETEIQVYKIDDITQKITDAVSAISGGVASKKTGVLMAGLVDEVEDEIELIKEDEKGKIEQ